jgi:hypothetical protein
MKSKLKKEDGSTFNPKAIQINKLLIFWSKEWTFMESFINKEIFKNLILREFFPTRINSLILGSHFQHQISILRLLRLKMDL